MLLNMKLSNTVKTMLFDMAQSVTLSFLVSNQFDVNIVYPVKGVKSTNIFRTKRML